MRRHFAKNCRQRSYSQLVMPRNRNVVLTVLLRGQSDVRTALSSWLIAKPSERCD
jgi:hypothetical protein